MSKQQRLVEKLAALVIILFGILGVILQLHRAYETGYFFTSTLFLLLYFTNQSNLLILVDACFVFFNYKKKWFDIFAFIAFANITITGLVFYIFLVQYLDGIPFVQHLLHTINPISYFLFYMFILETKLQPKHGLYGLIYPAVFFLYVFVIVHPLLGDLIYAHYPNEPDMQYVYPFFNPDNYTNGFSGVLIFTFLKLLPAIGILSVLLLKLKTIMNQKLPILKNAYQ